MKKDDYLDRHAYKAGEFERLQAAYDAQVRWLAAMLDAPMSQCWADSGPEQALEVFAQWFPGEPLPDEQTVREALDDAALESSGLLAQQALHCWYWHERESPALSLEERARLASDEALRQEGWDSSAELRSTLMGALSRGIPAELR